MNPTHNDLLLETSIFQTIVDHAEEHAEDFHVTLTKLIAWFFEKLEQTVMTWLPDIQSLTTPIVIQHLIDHLTQTRNTVAHKYKKLHYTYVISLLKERLLACTVYAGKRFETFQLLTHILSPGDVVLLSSTRSQTEHSLHAATTKFVATSLQAVTQSPFCHIGIVGNHDPQHGFELYHSTSASVQHHTWVKHSRLRDYLTQTSPCYMLVLRYTALTPAERAAIVSNAQWLQQKHIPYDTGDALSDITWLTFLKSEHRYNCGRFVYECLKSLCPLLHKKGTALPATYESLPFLEQVYLQKF